MASSTLSLLDSLTPISQGAEAKVYRHKLHGSAHPAVLLKHRFAKKYRHPDLDNSLTKGRLIGEARMLLKCLKNGVRVPGVRMVDVESGLLGLEWIVGRSVRSFLAGEDEGSYEKYAEIEDEVMRQMGIEIAKMHRADVIHGDLTTSNMMLRSLPSPADTANAELVLIDFGLSFVSNLVEDKAVDLYVLERAFASTHPDSGPWFDAVLQSYGKQSAIAWDPIHKRLESVRLRGRKRSMVG